MIFLVLSILVPVMVYFTVPRLIRAGSQWRWLLFAACFVYLVSWYIPSPLADGQQTQFMTHFVGGGIFTGLLWLYAKLAKKWWASWWIEAASLFALVSALGVANELFELLLYITGHMPLGIADTSWDLLANTLGSLTVYVMYAINQQCVQGRSGDRPES